MTGRSAFRQRWCHCTWYNGVHTMLSSSSAFPDFGLSLGVSVFDFFVESLTVLHAARSADTSNFLLGMMGPQLVFGPSGFASVSRNPTHFSRESTVHVQMTLLEESSSEWLLLNTSFRAWYGCKQNMLDNCCGLRGSLRGYMS